jgi:hypothetical protein
MLFDKRLALLLPTQTFNQRMTGEKHKKKNEITFQFHNTIEESALNFLKANEAVEKPPAIFLNQKTT